MDVMQELQKSRERKEKENQKRISERNLLLTLLNGPAWLDIEQRILKKDNIPEEMLRILFESLILIQSYNEGKVFSVYEDLVNSFNQEKYLEKMIALITETNYMDSVREKVSNEDIIPLEMLELLTAEIMDIMWFNSNLSKYSELEKTCDEKNYYRVVNIERINVARTRILRAWKEFMDEHSWNSSFSMFLNETVIQSLTVSQLFNVVNDFAAQAEEKDWKRIECKLKFLPEIDRSAVFVVEETSALRLKRMILERYFRENARKKQSMYEFFNTVEVRGMPAGIVLEVFQDLLIENHE